MKKIIFLFSALFTYGAMSYAQQANIYASELSAGTVSENNEVAFTYTLNADATALSIQILNDDETTAKTLPLTDAELLTKGTHTAAVTVNGVAAGLYGWSVTATAAANEDATPVQVYGDESTTTFITPRGLAIDKNFESPFFGRIYVSDSKNTETNGGIFVFDAALTDVSNQGTTPWSQVFSGSGASPFRVTVASDSRVYITDWSDNATSGVYVWDPATPETNAISIFGGTVGAEGVAKEGDVSIHGSVSHCYVEGTGADTKLYTYDEDLTYNDAPARFNSYNIGNLETPWVAAPTAISIPGGIVNGCGMILPDNKGGWWIGQHRWGDASANPAVTHINGEGTADYASSGEFTADLAYNTRGAMAFNTEQTLIATIGDNAVKIFDVTYDEAGVPSITAPQRYTLTTTFAATCYSVEFDVAGNVYAVGAAKAVNVWALPKAANTFTTPAPSSAKINLTQTGLISVTAVDLNKQVTVTPAAIKADGLTIDAYTLYNVSGQIVRTAKVNARRAEIAADNLPSGVYLLSVKTTEGTIVKRFIK